MTTLIDGNVHAAQAAREDQGPRRCLRRPPWPQAPPRRRHRRRPSGQPRLCDDQDPHGRRRAASTAGSIELPETVARDALLAEIARLNDDPPSTASWCSCRLPGHLDGQMMIDAIRPEKDVDGFHPMNVGKLCTAAKIDPERMLIPCTPLGSMILLRETLGFARSLRQAGGGGGPLGPGRPTDRPVAACGRTAR